MTIALSNARFLSCMLRICGLPKSQNSSLCVKGRLNIYFLQSYHFSILDLGQFEIFLMAFIT